MASFDPTTAKPVGGFDPTTAKPVAAKRPAATGFDMIGETINTIVNPKSAKGKAPNALEQGIMDVGNSKLLQGLKANYKEAVFHSPIMMQPTRMVMEKMGVGMDELKRRYPGKSQEWYDKVLHKTYSLSVNKLRADATAEANANKIGVAKIDTPEERAAGKAKPTIGERAARGGQMAVNLTADLFAHPEYFLIPELGVGKTAATRIATSGGGNAALAGLENAASQALDIATDTKKDFDVQQNLEMSLGAGLFGVGFRGGIEVAPFVKNLFKARGVDTTPSATPFESRISPLTQDHVPLNRADAMEYEQLLKTGSVDDIKAFFNGRNGPAPSWQDVNTWVQHRDGVTRTGPIAQELKPKFDYEAEYNNQTLKQQAEQNRSAIKEHIDNQMSTWKNSPQVEVIHGPEDIVHPEIRNRAIEADANGDALGFLGADGQVRIYSGRIPDAETANAVLFHEGLGHFGLAQKFGDRLDQVIGTLLERNVNQFAKKVNAWQKANPKAYGGDRIRAAEEVLAEASQNGRVKSSWSDAIGAAVRQFGRKMGLKLAYTDAEINHILSMAHDAVINGVPSAAANGFRGNKFMFIGPRAKDFDPNSATLYTDKAGNVWNEISDKGAKVKKVNKNKSYFLDEVLDHPELYEQYPELRDVPVSYEPMPDGGQAAYRFKPWSDELGEIAVDKTARVFGPDPRRVMLHETQHAVQDIEGLAGRKGSARLSNRDYRANQLEQQAFATEDRRNWSEESRQQNPPKFITKRQLAAEEDYTAENLDKIYDSLGLDQPKITRSWAEDRRDALDLGFKPSQIKDLKERDPGELSTRIRRIGAAANMADQRVSELNKKLGTPDWSMDDQMQYVQALADLNYLVQRAMGEASEYGRALNAVKAIGSYRRKSLDQIRDMLDSEGSGLADLIDDPTRFMKFATKVKEMMDTGQKDAAHALMKTATKPYWEQYLTSYHYNAMLSGLGTHIRAPKDMIVGIYHNIVDHTLAMPIGKAANIIESLTGQTVKPGVTANEVSARLYGVLRAVVDHEVYTKTLQAAKTGEGGAVLPGGQVVSSEAHGVYGGPKNPRIGLASKPTDLIIAEDTYFRSVSMSETLYGLGARKAEAELKASGEPYTRDDVWTLGASYARDPTPEMLREAKEVAAKTLLLNPNQLTNWLDKVKTVRPGANPAERLGAWIAQNFAPFIRVSANSLVTRTLERSPMAFLSKSIRQKIAEGGPEAHTALARIAYGTVVIGLAWNAADAAKDKLTGSGPDNLDKRKELMAAGWREDAVHENGTYRTGDTLAASINPFDMHNQTAQAVADLRHAWEKGANKGQVVTGLKLALGSLLHYMESQSWVNSIAPAVEAANSDRNEGSALNYFVGSQAKSWVPNILNQAAQWSDQTQRDIRPETDNIDPTNITGAAKNSIMSAVPGLKQQLPIKYSVYGDPLEIGLSATGAHRTVAEPTDPVKIELNRLATLPGVTSAIITPVQRTLSPGEDDLAAIEDNNRTDLKVDENGKLRLTTAQFEEYQRLAGRAIVETVREEMSNPEWSNMSDADKIATVREIQTDMRKAAREALFYGPKS